MMEQEIKQELANNEEINQIYADWKQEIDNEQDSQDSDWSDEDKHGHKDMNVDNNQFYVNRTNNGNTNSHHTLKWPYKTVSERLILNDIFMMMKGLDTVSTNM